LMAAGGHKKCKPDPTKGRVSPYPIKN